MVNHSQRVFFCLFVELCHRKYRELDFNVSIVIANFSSYFSLFLSQTEMCTSCAFFFPLGKCNHLEEVQISLVTHFYLVFLLYSLALI